MNHIFIKETSALTTHEAYMVNELISECFGRYKDYIYDLEEYILLYFTGDSNDKLVSLIQITKDLQLTCICTDPEYRRYGYAKELMNRAIEFTHNYCEKYIIPHILKLVVLEDNQIAIQFYAKYGFTVDYQDTYMMPDGQEMASLIMSRIEI